VKQANKFEFEGELIADPLLQVFPTKDGKEFQTVTLLLKSVVGSGQYENENVIPVRASGKIVIEARELVRGKTYLVEGFLKGWKAKNGTYGMNPSVTKIQEIGYVATKTDSASSSDQSAAAIEELPF
jgi:primosomal replication protein N